VVALARGRKRDELAQRKKRDEPNSTVATVSPSVQPVQNTVDISQEVRSRPLKSLSFWVCRSSSCVSLSDITKAATLMMVRMPKTSTNSRPTWCEGERLRKKVFIRIPAGQSRLARARQEFAAVFTGAQAQSARRKSPSTGWAPARPRPWA
jgi:hypothetical protein